MANKPETSNLIFLKNSDLNTTFTTLATKTELKGEQSKIFKLQVCLSTNINMLDLKTDKSTEYVTGWKVLKIYLIGNFFH